MTARARSAAHAPFGGPRLDPLRCTWAFLSNVKVALLLVAMALLASLLGVVLPQMPGPMRSNAAARAAWLELRREDFGLFTDAMERTGLFDVFHSAWFNGLWVLIIVAVTVCTVSRLRPTVRSVRHPVKRVGEGYFAAAHHRADFSHAGGVEAIEGALRRRRYRVERTATDGGATYLFAQRYGWAAYGTFASHLALLMLLVGALLTRFAGFDQTFVLAEGTPAAPVFDRPGPGQLFVTMLDAYRRQDAAGNVVDYHSDIEVRRGDETVRCTATVNDPCRAFGYKVHQAAFFDDIARLKVTGPDGRVVYDDVLDFDSQATAVPAMRVTDAAGALLFDQVLPQMASEPGDAPGRKDDVALAGLTFPRAAGSGETVTLPVSWRVEGKGLVVVISGQGTLPRQLKPGEPATVGGYRVEYTGPRSIPAVRVGDMPGAAADEVVTVQMPVDHTGRPYLFVTGLGDDNTVLEPGKPLAAANGYTYTFAERVEASGVSVKRDPGSAFIWVAVGLALAGLGVTFYVPRRRLWVKVTPARTYLAGVAERSTRFSRELRRMGAAMGSRDALQPGDEEE